MQIYANLCMHILASIFQDGGNSFPISRLPVLSSVTDSSRHTLLLPTLHSYGSRQVYIRHRRNTGFHVVQEATCTHAHEYRLLGASSYFFLIIFFFGVTFEHANLCQPANYYNYSKNELPQIKTIFFKLFLPGVKLAPSESAVQCPIHWASATGLDLLLQNLIFNKKFRFQAPSTFQNGRFGSSRYLWSVSIMLATATPQ